MSFRGMLWFFVLFGISITTFGQGFQGGLRGSARDQGGAVVPGVEVTLTNEATSLSRSTVTNESGEYSFAALEPGSYRLTISMLAEGIIWFDEMTPPGLQPLVYDVTVRPGVDSPPCALSPR